MFTARARSQASGGNSSTGAKCRITALLTPNIESRLQRLMAERGVDREAATREFLAGKQPVARFVPAEHVAELIAFLCSESAAEINGANMPVDHGWLAT